MPAGRLFSRLFPLALLAAFAAPQFASADGLLDRVAYAVDGAESSHGSDPRMWRGELDGPQGPMQVSAAAAADAGGGDRFDETQNRVLGRAYLTHLYRRYRSWPDAIAAYNWGPGHLDEWINGGRLPDKFPAAVERYKNRVLVGSGLPAAEGGTNLRLSRLDRLRMLARRELAERLRGSWAPDAVQVLYTELMRSRNATVP